MAAGALTLALALAAPAGAQLHAKREELSRIQSELKRALEELDQLKASEKSIGADVKGLESKDAESRRRLERLQEDVRRAESRRAELRGRLDSARSVAGFWAAAIGAEASRASAAAAGRSDAYGARELWAEELRRAAIVEKARHLRGLRGFGRKTEEAAEQTGRRARELDDSRRRAQAERAAGRKEYEEKKAALEQAQERVAAAERRAKELEESAKALTALLQKLGRTARLPPVKGPTPRLELPRHSLPWPAAGRVLRPFGRERDPELGTWTVRQGATFAVPAGASIGAVAAGRVIFAGPFRSYGRVVIVDHGAGFFSVYGELGELAKGKGDEVRAGETLARAGAEKGEGRYYLELRRGTDALDPAEWLERR